MQETSIRPASAAIQPPSTMQEPSRSNRLVSLDVMRGLIMILLAGESARIYDSLHELHWGIADGLVRQFFHHPWHGLHFWDLVQPAFMMMAGTAMYISYYQKAQKGITWEQNFKHIAIRSAKLFLFGTALHCVYAGKMVWELWNVLTQLSFTTLVSYWIIRKPATFQIIVAVLLVALNDVLYRAILMPGFDQPFTAYHNFGAYADTLLMGKINTDGWVAINCIPTAAHTIGGAVIGQLMMKQQIAPARKVSILLLTGGVLLAAGFGLDLTGITPIIKRISTSSFVLASAGWVTLILAFLYWLIDIRKYQRWAWVATVVGMNAIFIYLFFETVGSQWVNPTVAIFTNGLTGWMHLTAHGQAVVAAFAVWALEWGLCYWLFKKKIFFKL